MKTVMNVAEAKAKLSELIDRAKRGEEVSIARKGKPAVWLIPVLDASTPKPNRTHFFGALEEMVPLTEDALAPEPLDAWYSEQGIAGFEVAHSKVAEPDTPLDAGR